jgi:hypothetical protein
MCLAFGALVVMSPRAGAQEIPVDQALELQQFSPAAGNQRFLTTRDGQVLGHRQLELGLTLMYASGALTIYNVADDGSLSERNEVVSAIMGAVLGGAYGLTDRLQLGLILPINFAMTGNGLDPETGMAVPGGLSVTGTGDALIELAWRLYAGDGLAVAAIPGVTLPSSYSFVHDGADKDGFLGDDLPSFRPRLAMTWSRPGSKWTLGLNIGVILQKPRTLYATEVGQQATFSGALAWRATSRVELVGEIFGRNAFSTDRDSSPLEADGAVRIKVSPTFTLVAGGGGGLDNGLGAPAFRAFAGLAWSPDYGDRDGDGVSNLADKCPDAAEDKDGWEDHDGCPDPDNDDDKIDDKEDKCPDQAEDTDGFQDDDGCPDPDNDNDGFPDDHDRCPDEAEDKIAPFDKDGCPATKRDSDDDGVFDANDKCPTEGEDKDGFQDDDGCPDPDNDADGVLDEADKCPGQPEDKDGYADDDGCPDPDNDADGVADAEDRCPGQQETINGVKDGDGCPDHGGKTLASMQGNLVQLSGPIAFDGKRIRSRSIAELAQVVLVMRSQTDVVKWRVVVAAEPQPGGDEVTRALGQQRAELIKAYLVSKGLPADQIEALGVVAGSASTGIAAIERGEAPPPQTSGAGEPQIEIEP